MTDKHRREFFALFNKAWAECRPANVNKEAWRKREMKTVVGTESTKQVDDARQFDRLMAHFEVLAANDIKYQTRWATGDVERLRHVLKGIDTGFFSRHFKTNAEMADWMRGIAEQAFGRKITDLHLLTDDQFDVVRRAACIQANREKQ